MSPAAVLLLMTLEWGNAGGGLTPCPHGFIGGGLTPCTQAGPAVEFAGPLNAGMGSVCAGTVPTLTNGTAISYSRFGSAMCTKTVPSGVSLTGIRNGDLVLLSDFKPRVEYAAPGQLAYLGEPAATNAVLQSQALDSPAWTKNGVGVVGPSVTADFAVSPDGTLSADRVVFAATIAGQASQLFQNACSTGAQNTGTWYVRGVSGSGTLDIWQYGGAVVCGACSYTSSSWTRCALTPSTPAAGATFVIGNDTATCGTPRAAADVLVWGAQCEVGAWATSYIPTTTASTTRAADTAALPATGSQYTQGSAAMSYVPAASASTGIYPPQLSFTTTSRMLYGNSPSVGFFDGVNNPLTAAGLTAGVGKRYWSSWSTGTGVVVRNATDGNQATSAFNLGTWVTDNAVELQGIAGVWPSGLLYNVCIDPDPARCR